jgi:mRNA interferase YafQ
MYKITATNQFKKEYKKAKKRGFDIKELEIVVDTLSKGEKLDTKHKDHELVGNYIGYRECHIKPDWLLIYKVENDKLILVLSRTGTHSDLF